MTTTPTSAPAVLKTLRLAAAATAILAIIQALMGVGVLIAEDTLKDSHGIVGMVTSAFACVAAIASILWMRQGGNKGLVGHAVGTAVLTIAQIGLGFAEMRGVHIALGLLILAAGTSLAAIAYNKPGGPSAA